MRLFIWMLAVTSVAAQEGGEPKAEGHECASITVHRHGCPAGTILASFENVTLCQEELCRRLDAWQLVGFDEPNVTFVGYGYAQHCGVQTYYGTPGEVLCVPGDEPPPTPPSENCGAITVETGSCPSGTILASYENVTLCQEELCSRIGTWEILGLAEPNVSFVGEGYAQHCGVQDYPYGTPGRVLCLPGDEPPTPPTPVPPTRECSAITVQRRSCPSGTTLASYENVTLCQEELCSRLETWEMVGFDEPNVTFVGSGYSQHCGVQTYYGTPGDVLCVPGDEPPPTPPSENCTAITVETGSCPAGTILASSDNVTLCQEDLCSRLNGSEMVGFEEPGVVLVADGYDHCFLQAYNGTPSEVLCVPGDEPPPTPPFENCSAITVETWSCPAGTILASSENVTLCQEELCSRLEKWEMAGFDEPDVVLVGDGYAEHCGVKSYSGKPWKVLCIPGDEPPPTPAPTPPSEDCSAITVQRRSCPEGTILASFENVTLCQEELCGRIYPWQMVGFDEPNVAFVGYGYAQHCGVQTYYGTPGDVLCVPGDEPPPTPPSENCSAITVETWSCPAGTILASSENVTLCQEELCSRLNGSEMVGFDEPGVVLVADGYDHCFLQAYNGTPSEVLCVPGDEPPPTPPSENCSAITVETWSCPSGTILASSENVTLCQEELCSRLNGSEMVGFDEPGVVLVADGYDHCFLQAYNGTPSEVLCVAGDAPPPTPPSENCSAITVETWSCPAGTILASSENVTLCQEELCSRLEKWEMAGFDEPDVVLVGDGYAEHCGVKSYSGKPWKVLCIPGDEPPPTPAPTPPSEDCSAITVQRRSCSEGTILASYENVTLCQEELCSRIYPWQMVGFDEPNVAFVGYGYSQHCGVQTYYGTPGDVLCVPGDEPPPTPPSENCSAITVETWSCPSGTILASSENVTLCQEELCSRLNGSEMVGFDEPGVVLVADGYDHCFLQAYNGTPSEVLCVPGDEPPPTPPSENCSAITVETWSCPAGTILASSENVTLCQEELCSRIGTWEMVGFDEPDVVLVGDGYAEHCGVKSYSGKPWKILCIPGDERPPTPTPTSPSESCSAITVQRRSCPAGTILASFENVTLCQEELCSRIDAWQMVGFDEPNVTFVGSGYSQHCGVQTYYGTPGEVLCVPGDEPPPTPPSENCSAITVETWSCPSGTILASSENVTLCQEELCSRLNGSERVGIDEPGVVLVADGYDHCFLQAYNGTPSEVLCVPDPDASLEAALSQSQPSSGVTSAAVRIHDSVSASSFILPVLFVVVGVLCVGVVRRVHANRLSQASPSRDLSEEVPFLA